VLVLAAALTACGSSPEAGRGGTPGFVGYKWRITDIRHGAAHVIVPATLNGFVAFDRDDTLQADDGVNAYSGRYRLAGDGYLPLKVASTAVGYAGHDRVQTTLIAAVGALTTANSNVSATTSGNRLELSTTGYTIVCSKLAPVPNGDSPSPTATPPATGSSPDALTVRITLDHTTVARGRRINGEATVTNSSGHPLTIIDCGGTWLQVGLTNAKIPYEPGWLACRSVPGTVLAPGVTHLHVVVQTTYQQCTPRASEATPDTPACGTGADSLMPSLPRGTYHTKVEMLSPDGVRIPQPDTIRVTLTG
jgi:hypothetical protein